jgi:hypothetical protein
MKDFLRAANKLRDGLAATVSRAGSARQRASGDVGTLVYRTYTDRTERGVGCAVQRIDSSNPG